MATDLLNRLQVAMSDLNHNVLMLEVDVFITEADFCIVGL